MKMNDATRLFIREHLKDDVRQLALKTVPDGIDKILALQQIEARRLLAKKVPSWADNEELLFPKHLSLEQCSSQLTALYKASLIKGVSLADLTGGLGIDTCFLSKNFQRTDYVEHQKELCDLAVHNFKVLDMDVNVFHEEASIFLNRADFYDCIFLDPARRDNFGRKMVSLHDCTPDVIELQSLLLKKAHRILIKMSPMLDISVILSELRCVKEIHIVAVANECKEILALIESDYTGEPIFRCIDLKYGLPSFDFYRDQEKNCPLILSDNVLRYLYEPNAVLLKAGAFKLVAQRYNLGKLHKNSHLYTSDELIPDFAGRIFEVLGCASLNKKIKQTLLKDINKASIAVRNFPLTATELRKRLRILDGDEIFLFGTTLKSDEKLIIKTKKVLFLQKNTE